MRSRQGVIVHRSIQSRYSKHFTWTTFKTEDLLHTYHHTHTHTRTHAHTNCGHCDLSFV